MQGAGTEAETAPVTRQGHGAHDPPLRLRRRHDERENRHNTQNNADTLAVRKHGEPRRAMEVKKHGFAAEDRPALFAALCHYILEADFSGGTGFTTYTSNSSSAR
jgi:hypothetical protein